MGSGDKPVLLVVDDEPEIREIIAFTASDIGFEVLEGGDGAMGLDILRQQRVDIVCSDLMMPKVSGITFLSQMREEGHHQPFILLTAYPSQDSTIQALRLGAFDYIEKPFDTEELKALLREALRVNREIIRLESSSVSDLEFENAPHPETQENEQNSYQEAVNIIKKLKALRFSSASTKESQQEVRQRIVELFISEVTPQLLFCAVAIKSLHNQDTRAFELGYLFRVMQSIAQAAAAINEHEISDFAKSCEALYTVMRVKPRSIEDSMITLSTNANECLLKAVSSIGFDQPPAKFQEIKEALKQATIEIGGLELAAS